MKKKILFSLLIISLLIITGCGKQSGKINGKEIALDKQYKDRYITYKYPSLFKEKEEESIYAYPLQKKMEYEYYENDKLTFILKVEELDAGISFLPMNEDKEKLDEDKTIKNLKQETVKSNGKNLVKFTFNKDDEFGTDTTYHLYYGGYSYAGINEFFKVYFINTEGNEDFEKAFISSFKINK